MEKSIPVILASSSPRRRELMKSLNIPYEVIIVPSEEKMNKKKSVYEQCMDIAYNKALNVYKNEVLDCIVIGSDTIVVHNDKIYGKPKDNNEAMKMIKALSGSCHEVVSSLCLLVRKNGVESKELTYETCRVYVDKMSKKEIEEWVLNNDTCSKAGGYAIQEGFGKYITKIEGDYFTIVGFPLNKVYRLLNKYL